MYFFTSSVFFSSLSLMILISELIFFYGLGLFLIQRVYFSCFFMGGERMYFHFIRYSSSAFFPFLYLFQRLYSTREVM